jgi:hypothetical protein|tara:strand:+ start:72 stop:293 length:222 start_codon:yes stop_codon:yes gene_type:complete
MYLKLFYLSVGMRHYIATLAAVLAVLSTFWLFLGMFSIVPLLFEIPGETSLRTHASITLIFLLIASWGFWNSD